MNRSLPNRLPAVLAFLWLLSAAPVLDAGAVWGSFSSTRVAQAEDALDSGSTFQELRAIVACAGGEVGPGTHLLDAGYLDGVDVFFTSRLAANTGSLTPNEQSALGAWIAAGGTLVVTADAAAPAVYDTITAPFGVSGYTAISNAATGDVVAAHPLTDQADGFSYASNVTFTHGPDALLLADDGGGDNPLMAVLEPSTGFTAGGRIVVVGDPDVFTSPRVFGDANQHLAFDVAKWASGFVPTGCVWGSFDVSRIPSAVTSLTTGSSQQKLREIIVARGGTIVPSTSALTPAALAEIDVFYTSQLDAASGALSIAEKAALANWIADGGTLIVTARADSLPAAASFTAVYGVSGYAGIGIGSTATVVASHPIAQGIASFGYAPNSTFSFGADALLLADSSTSNPYLAVLEPSTGFTAGGRIAVFGSVPFLAAQMTAPENVKLAENLVDWACDPPAPLCPNDAATSSVYGAGWPGTFGVPPIAALDPPVTGATIDVFVGNSRGAATTAFPLVGAQAATIATPLGGTILVDFLPALANPLPMAASGFVLTGQIPYDATLCGASLRLQVLEVDPGASHGASFTRGLTLTLGG